MADLPAVEHDVVILGSGAAGLVAAIAAADEGASVGVYEKADLIGGTSAMSGGIVWMPNNHLQAEAGIEDSRRMALDYLDSLSLGQIDSDMAAMFVDEGPAAIRHLDEQTPCSFHLLATYPDYHPEHAGGLPNGGRSIDNGLFAFDELGEWAARVRNHRGANPVMLIETPLGGATSMPPPELIGERVQNRENGMGLGLVGALLRGCLDRGIEPVIGARARSLIQGDDGVTGVEFEMADGSTQVVTARRGVIIATGGFEWNPELVRTFLRGPMSAPAGSPDNTGDGLELAMAAGARLGNMRNAWWVPVVRTPGHEYFGKPAVHLILLERTRPRSIMINDKGERFTNEAGNYNAMGGILHAFDPATFDYPNNPCWLVFDHGHKQRYDVAGCPPGDEAPDWMLTADSVEELAETMGVPVESLQGTVDRFNDLVAAGHDDDFGRGDSAYDTFNGDQSLLGIDATLGPLDQGPFYAVRMELGALGTNGGPKTDTRCRVLSLDGGIIGGLYAVGNAMAAPTGMVYGGAGGTLGPAITTGFVAGRDAAQN
jgi:succinate dehydrogenase/fumarate reductase flavoprotein subunit